MYTTLAIIVLLEIATILCIGYASDLLISSALAFGIIFYVIAIVLFAVKIYRKIKLKNQPSAEKINENSSALICDEDQKNYHNYCVIDIETTGLSRISDQIIEVSAVRVRDDNIVETFTQLVKPTIPIPAEVTKINGITDEMKKNALTINEVIPKFMEFIGDDIVIGHNIYNFDLEFIIPACYEAGIPFHNSYLDTYLLAKDAFTNMPDYKLATLCGKLGIAIPTHRAEADCISNKALYDKLKESNDISK